MAVLAIVLVGVAMAGPAGAARTLRPSSMQALVESVDLVVEIRVGPVVATERETAPNGVGVYELRRTTILRTLRGHPPKSATLLLRQVDSHPPKGITVFAEDEPAPLLEGAHVVVFVTAAKATPWERHETGCVFTLAWGDFSVWTIANSTITATTPPDTPFTLRTSPGGRALTTTESGFPIVSLHNVVTVANRNIHPRAC